MVCNYLVVGSIPSGSTDGDIMGIHRVKIPEEHQDIIDNLADKDGNQLLLRAIKAELKANHKEFWKAVKAAIPEVEDVEENLHYMPDKKEVYWID